MRKGLTAIMLLTGLVGTPACVLAETVLETVELFYQAATTEGLCDKAIQIRPGYTLDQCRQFKTVKIRVLELVKESETEAVVYLRMKFKTNKSQRFNGYLHLYKEVDQWQIIGSDYRSRKSMSKAQYIKTFMGTAKKIESTNVVTETDTLSGNHREVLDRLEKEYPNYAKKNPVVLVDTSEQEMYLYVKKHLKRIYPVSTAAKGEGSEEGSDQTPLGVHVIKAKFGKNAPLGTIFVGRQNTGRIAEIIRQSKNMPEDFVTSRIMWLRGLEEGKNKGEGIDSYKRFIYIHGTAEEGLIGRKASHGCIRMYNKHVIKVFNKLPVGSLVYIGR